MIGSVGLRVEGGGLLQFLVRAVWRKGQQPSELGERGLSQIEGEEGADHLHHGGSWRERKQPRVKFLGSETAKEKRE